MNKKSIALMLTTAIVLNSSALNVSAAKIEASGDNLVEASSENTENYTFEVQNGVNKKITNINKDKTVTINTNASNYYGNVFDYTVYDANNGVVSYNAKCSDKLTLKPGESAVISVYLNKDTASMKFTTTMAEKDLMTVEDSQNPALVNFTLEKGKNYKLKNNNNFSVKLRNNGSGYYNKVFDFTIYSNDLLTDVKSYNHDESSEVSLNQGESVVLSNVNAESTSFWFPYDYLNNLKPEEITDQKALELFTIEKGKSFSIVNNNNNTIKITNNSSGYYNRRYDFIKYDKTQQIKEFSHNVTGDISLNQGESIRLTGSEENTLYWLPAAYFKNIIKTETAQSALKVTKLYKGKNYTLKNNNEYPVRIVSDTSNYYGRVYDYVKYSALNAITDFNRNSNGDIVNLEPSESIKMTPVSSITTWLPEEYSKNFEVTEVAETALKYYTADFTHSIILKNKSDKNVSFKTNGSGFGSVNADIINYDKDSNVYSYEMDKNGSEFELSSNTSIRFTSRLYSEDNSKKYTIWTPFENNVNVEAVADDNRAIYEFKILPGNTVVLENISKQDHTVPFSGKMDSSLFNADGTLGEKKNGNSCVLLAGQKASITNTSDKVVSAYIPLEILNTHYKLSGDYKDVSVEGIYLNKNNDKVLVGGKTSLGYTIMPVNANNRKVTWKSSDEKIATVDANGVITGVGVGQANITAISEDGSKMASGIIYVVDKMPNIYDVTIVDNLGNQFGDVQKIEQGLNAVLPSSGDMPTVEGMKFLGWNESEKNINKNTTITAVYVPENVDTAKEYTVQFVVDGNNYGEAKKVKFGQNVAKPNDPPAKEGYVFTGWDQSLNIITKDLVINAVYEKAQAGSATPGNPTDKPQEGGDTPGGTGTPGGNTPGSNTPGDNTPTQKSYKVTFMVAGKPYGDVQTIPENGAAKKPNDPVVDGYTFKGWDKSFDKVTGDITVSAILEKKQETKPTGDATKGAVSILGMLGAITAFAMKKNKRK